MSRTPSLTSFIGCGAFWVETYCKLKFLIMRYYESEHQHVKIDKVKKCILIYQHDYDRTIALYFGFRDDKVRDDFAPMDWYIAFNDILKKTKGTLRYKNPENPTMTIPNIRLEGDYFAKGEYFLGMDYWQGTEDDVDTDSLVNPCKDLSQMLYNNLIRYNTFDEGTSHTIEEIINETIDAHNYNNLNWIEAPYYTKYQETNRYSDELKIKVNSLETKLYEDKAHYSVKIKAMENQIARLRTKYNDEFDYQANNLALAKFVGVETDENGLYLFTTSLDDYKTDTLQFDTSWDWLQVVVAKCWAKANDLDIDTATMLYDYNFIHVAQGRRDDSYKAVCEFVDSVVDYQARDQDPCMG